jgi:hypothetical protein
MPPEQRLADYLADVMTGPERAEFEAGLAADPEALRGLVEQRRLDAALSALLDTSSERIETAILASIRGVSDETVQARVLDATVFAEPAPCRPGAWAAIFNWRHLGTRWRWAGAAVALVAIGVWALAFWGRPTADPGGHSLPAPELAGLSLDRELLRELAPLVAVPPVWAGSEQQAAWLTALAAAIAPGGNDR